jgi:hypothetical protein
MFRHCQLRDRTSQNNSGEESVHASVHQYNHGLYLIRIFGFWGSVIPHAKHEDGDCNVWSGTASIDNIIKRQRPKFHVTETSSDFINIYISRDKPPRCSILLRVTCSVQKPHSMHWLCSAAEVKGQWSWATFWFYYSIFLKGFSKTTKNGSHSTEHEVWAYESYCVSQYTVLGALLTSHTRLMWLVRGYPM